MHEALTALAAEGLVVSQEQRGFRVAPVSRTDLIDLTEARVLIERQLIRLAVRKVAMIGKLPLQRHCIA